MIRQISIGDQQVELSSSAGWLYVYRAQFGRDILPDLMPIIESVVDMATKVLGKLEGTTIEFTDVMTSMDEDTVSDIMINLSTLELTTMLNIVWAMAKKADKTIEPPEDFFDRFEIFPIDEVVPEIFRMILESSISTKNAERLLTMMDDLKQKLSRSTDSQSPELTEG